MNSFHNKINFAPINTGFAVNGVYTTQVFSFYQKRSGKNIHKVCIGNVAPSLEYATNKNTATFINENHANLSKLLHIIEDCGSIPSIQIGFRHSPIPPQKNWDNNKKAIKLYSNYISSLTQKNIQEYFSLITKNVNIAHKLGYKSIQIHAAHGYLLSLLMCSQINKRQDCFSYANIAGIEILFDMLSQYVNKVDIRINLLDGVEESALELEKKKCIIDYLYKHPMISTISLSNGIYDINKALIYPTESEAKSYLTNACKITNGYEQKKFEIAGRCELLARSNHEQLLQTTFQLAIGRGLIANPRLAENILLGTTCTQCGQCHYFSNGKEYLTCPIDERNSNTKEIENTINLI